MLRYIPGVQSFRVSRVNCTYQYKIMLWALKLVALLVSIITVWQPRVWIPMHIAILCLKEEQNLVCE